MDVCSSCRRPRKEGTQFCTGCGNRFPDDRADPVDWDSGRSSGWDNTRTAGGDSAAPRVHESPGPVQSRGSPRPRSARPIIAAVAVVLVIGGITGGTVFYLGHHSSGTEAVRTSGDSARVTAQGGGSDATPGEADSAPTSSPSSLPSTPSPATSSVGQVTIAADVSQDPDASSVATFLNQYFTSINNHDYQSYISLLSSQDGQGLTQEQFDNGYGSTVDSAETLLGISTAANGDLVASVTFSSHQNPADSPDQQESCTDWNISVFLEQGGGGYLIDKPPPSYHASYQACP